MRYTLTIDTTTAIILHPSSFFLVSLLSFHHWDAGETLKLLRYSSIMINQEHEKTLRNIVLSYESLDQFFTDVKKVFLSEFNVDNGYEEAYIALMTNELDESIARIEAAEKKAMEEFA
jgi:hypothetical protein